jgi:hypothetical protein
MHGATGEMGFASLLTLRTLINPRKNLSTPLQSIFSSVPDFVPLPTVPALSGHLAPFPSQSGRRFTPVVQEVLRQSLRQQACATR